MTALSNAGFLAIAIDLPGFGSTESLKHKYENHVLLGKIIKSLSLEKPAIISPSMSGVYSLDYIFHNPNAVFAFIPVAPTFPENIANISSGEIQSDAIPAAMRALPGFIVWGSKDLLGKRRSKALLSIFPKSTAFEIAEGSHPCYMDEPDMFNRAVVAFLNNQLMLANLAVK